VEAKICAEGRKDLFEWVARNVAKQGDQPVLLQLVKPISMGLQVRVISSPLHKVFP
jgi:cytoskeleton-associated protein 5